MYGFENKTTNVDIDLMLEITEAFTFKIVIVNNEELIRPNWDKVPVIAFNDKVNIYSCFHYTYYTVILFRSNICVTSILWMYLWML